MANPQVGDFVEFAQVANGQLEWLPFLVTHAEGDVLTGVAFTGRPATVDYPDGGSQAFANVIQGEDNRQWRPKADDEQDAEGGDEQPPSPFESPSDE